jgi:hypothetical protein
LNIKTDTAPVWTNGTWKTEESYKAIRLSPDSPLGRELLSVGVSGTSSIPEARLNRPLISWIRDDLLIAKNETVEIIMEVANTRDPKMAESKLNGVMFGNWSSRVSQEALAPLKKPDGSAWYGMRNTTIVVSTGPKWNGESLKNFTEPLVTHAFAHGVRDHQPCPLFYVVRLC